ncbi:MAG: hypothetical protein D3906_15495, partial [Candidatus Electrothrix sp. AUS1_2]|nr:hypothetical protein [Candidatus Electrothrix sp. AUS1_2]
AKSNDECRWGSLLLATYGHEFSFDEISRRVSVKRLGYVVKRRGCKPEEVAVYAEILNRTMSDSYTKPDALAEVVAFHPEYVKQWVEGGFLHNKIWHHQFFYTSLCEVLLDKHPEQGKQLFLEMRKHKKIDPAPFFKAGNSDDVFSLRDDLLKKAVTDNDLFEIAFLAQKHDRIEWLKEVITTYLHSDFALNTAKGLFLLGFMDDPSAGERLDDWITEKKPSWLHDCASEAKMIHQRNQWAHHWFERFITHNETLQAWAAFRLFLRCVDRRFWLWGKEMIYSPDAPYERFEHYRACRKSIKEAIKENEGKSPLNLKDHLVGWKVQENELWPWLGPYLQEEPEPE